MSTIVMRCASELHYDADYSTLKRILELTKNPVNTFTIIGKNLIFNGKNINGDANRTFEAIKNKDYYNFGKNFGSTLIDATTQKEDLFLF
jgi:hypothetical protein